MYYFYEVYKRGGGDSTVSVTLYKYEPHRTDIDHIAGNI